ncbi:MAG: hypothetical protein WCK53_13060 [Methanomicrobiales archaeon]
MVPKFTVIVRYAMLVSFVEPVIVSDTWYDAGVLYSCVVTLLFPDVVPSPKFHNLDAGLPWEVSVKVTVSGAIPETGVAVKEAAIGGETGVRTFTVVVTVLVDPSEPVTVRAHPIRIST